MTMPKKVQRGEIYWCDLGEAVGSEQGGCRPVIIVQNDIGNTYSTTTIVVPLTTKIKKTTLPTHYEFVNNGVKQVACAEQIRTVDKLRLGTNLGFVRKEDVEAISRCVQIAVEEIKFVPKNNSKKKGKEEMPVEAPQNSKKKGKEETPVEPPKSLKKEKEESKVETPKAVPKEKNSSPVANKPAPSKRKTNRYYRKKNSNTYRPKEEV